MARTSPSFAARFRSFQCSFPGCTKVCKTARGLKRHHGAKHPVLSSDESDNEARPSSTFQFHPKLTALPVDGKGTPLPKFTKPAPRQDLPAENPFHPFTNRLAFDFAHYQYVELQSSISKTNTGLDLWLASKVEAYKELGADPADASIPWTSAEQLKETIDQIQQGDAPFVTLLFKYSGPMPQNPPRWMTQTYELCVRDVRQVIKQQLDTPDFANDFDKVPYRQFQPDGDRIFSNLFSGDWVWKEADKISTQVEDSEGAMVVPVVSGLDKTTVSVATGSQEYHPFYVSPGNLSNTARRSHGNGVVPVAFLPIPKTNKRQKKKKEYHQFVRQLYHACIAQIFEPLRDGMSQPEVVRCPDGHFRRAVYSIGPVIADYPEQVWLAGIVQGWCAKCTARPEDLDNPKAGRRTQRKMEKAVQMFDDPGILWDKLGLRDDVLPFTYTFPRADIHELIAPDLLHQLIKGTFKDHLVTWITDYILAKNGENKGLEIIADIDRRISGVPIYPGLRRFQDGRDFAQWTGDDSKALMKVYLAAIVGYVPDEMVQCLASFLEMCYIFRRNGITTTALNLAKQELAKFHKLREIFVEAGTRTHCSLPRQHALSHFIPSIILFGSPNGLCSSITESRHITAVKEPWRRSSRFNALSQMLLTITRLEKMATLRRLLTKEGLMKGSTSMSMASNAGEGDVEVVIPDEEDQQGALNEAEFNQNTQSQLDDVGPAAGPRLASSVMISKRNEPKYPKTIAGLGNHLDEPQFEEDFLKYLFTLRHPNRQPPSNIYSYGAFAGRVNIHHSATARFYAPSDACGAGGMQRQIIRCNPKWRGECPRLDTVFVSQSEEPGMRGMLIAQLRLLFSFHDPYTNQTHSCALVSWFNTCGEEPDPVTGMWVVEREVIDGRRPLQIIGLDTIVRGAHLLPVFGEGRLPEGFSYTTALDRFARYFVNPYVDYHVHELLAE